MCSLTGPEKVLAEGLLQVWRGFTTHRCVEIQGWIVHVERSELSYFFPDALKVWFVYTLCSAIAFLFFCIKHLRRNHKTLSIKFKVLKVSSLVRYQNCFFPPNLQQWEKSSSLYAFKYQL